jgi:hypothetical protein
MKNIPTTKEETRKGLRRGSTRVLVATALGAGLGVVALPLGIGFALAGAAYPELFRIFRKKPKEISKK